MRARRWVAATLAATFAAAGCGKDPNTHQDTFLEFPHVLPERPAAIEDPAAPAWTSGHGLAATSDVVYVADTANGQVVRVDASTLAPVGATAVGAGPQQLVVGPSGDVLVTVRGEGRVVRLAPGGDTVAASVDVGAEPVGIALSVDGDTAYVTLAGESALVVLDAATLDELQRVDTVERPRAVAASPLRTVTVVGQYGAVTVHRVSAGAAPHETLVPISRTDLALREGNPADLRVRAGRRDGLHPTRALAAVVHPGDGTVLVAHVQAEPGTIDSAMGQATGGTEVATGGYGAGPSAEAPFDVPARPVETTVTAIDETRTARLEAVPPVQDPKTGLPVPQVVSEPRDIVHHPSQTLAFVAGEGSDNVLVLTTASSDPMRSPLGVIDVGRAPRALAVSPDGSTLYVLNGHDLTVGAVDIAPLADLPSRSQDLVGDLALADTMGFPLLDGVDTPSVDWVATPPVRLDQRAAVAFADDPSPEAVRRGRRTFTFAGNARLSADGTFACATCHFEGGEDKLVWFITDGPRQTPALAGRLHDTAPYNWNGSKHALGSNMEQTVERMGEGLTGDELSDLEAFLLDGLVAPANPNRRPDGALTPLQEQGRAIFEDPAVGCASCHGGAPLTDGLSHDVGTLSDEERFLVEMGGADHEGQPGRYNTPKLRGLHYTAPYLHDGSAPTLRDALERTADTMGKTSHLGDDQLDALVAYLLTL